MLLRFVKCGRETIGTQIEHIVWHRPEIGLTASMFDGKVGVPHLSDALGSDVVLSATLAGGPFASD
jgi:hypothetical protein